MTKAEKVEHEKLLKELGELKRENYDLYCELGCLRDAVADIVFGWKESTTPPTEQQLDYLKETYDKG